MKDVDLFDRRGAPSSVKDLDIPSTETSSVRPTKRLRVKRILTSSDDDEPAPRRASIKSPTKSPIKSPSHSPSTPNKIKINLRLSGTSKNPREVITLTSTQSSPRKIQTPNRKISQHSPVSSRTGHEHKDTKKHSKHSLISPSSTKSTPKRAHKRDASPVPELVPLERTPEQNFDVSYIVMFRARFRAAFTGTPDFSCQDIEAAIVSPHPTAILEQFLARLISLGLNRKKAVERTAYQQALFDVVEASMTKCADRSWNGVSPLSKDTTFNALWWDDRLRILRTLVDYALQNSEVIRDIIEQEYVTGASHAKHRPEDVPLAVVPLGSIEKVQFWLIEGKDTRFRLVRETDKTCKVVNWEPVAGTIDELRAFAKSLKFVQGKARSEAQALGEKILELDIPRMEQIEVRRVKAKVREQRLAELMAQDSGYSMRPRRKPIHYARDNFSTDEDEDKSKNTRGSDATTNSVKDTAKTQGGRESRAAARAVRNEETKDGTYEDVSENDRTKPSHTIENRKAADTRANDELRTAPTESLRRSSSGRAIKPPRSRD